MDPNEIKLTAKFKVLYAKETGNKIDLVKFASDNAYARDALSRATQTESEELLVVAMQLMQSRGLLPESAEKKEENGKATDKVKDKYRGGLR